MQNSLVATTILHFRNSLGSIIEINRARGPSSVEEVKYAYAGLMCACVGLMFVIASAYTVLSRVAEAGGEGDVGDYSVKITL